MTKILLVDDSKFLRVATERALSRAGYNVITADEGPKAIELAKTEGPDVILLDMLLPGMTGPDVLKILNKDSSTAAIPVIAFTGLSQKNATRLQKDGACAFLEKSALGLDKGSEALLNALGEDPAGTEFGSRGWRTCAGSQQIVTSNPASDPQRGAIPCATPNLLRVRNWCHRYRACVVAFLSPL